MPAPPIRPGQRAIIAAAESQSCCGDYNQFILFFEVNVRQILLFLAAFLVILCFSDGRTAAQTSAQTGAGEPGTGVNRRPRSQLPGRQEERDREAVELEKRLAKERNQERFAKLKRDTDELLRLATELKKYVDESRENTLSLQVIRKAEEIEKLAKSVKEKMKGSS